MTEPEALSGNVTYTLSGIPVHLTRPHPDMIDWNDVFHALSLENRYNGHTLRPFSVGQHLVAMLLYVEEWDTLRRRVTLLHDCPEYVLKDQTSPLKPLLGEMYERLTIQWENTFCLKAGWFSGPFFRDIFELDVKPVDRLAGVAESTLLQPNRPSSFPTCKSERMQHCVRVAVAMDPFEVRTFLHGQLEELSK